MKKIITILLGLGFLLCPPLAFGIDVHVAWDASPSQNVDGYRVYWGESQDGPFSNQLCEVDATTRNCPITLNETQEYFIICRAFNSYGESDDSNIVHWNYSLPSAPTNLIWSIDLVELMKNIGADRIKFVSK